MKIPQIFTPKTYSVDRHNLRYLLSNLPTKRNGNILTTKLSTQDGNLFDLRGIGGETVIEIGKSKLEVNTVNGKVLSYKKPFFKSLKKLVNQATEFVTFLSNNFKNPDKVKKSTLETLTFTKEQAKKLFDSGKKFNC